MFVAKTTEDGSMFLAISPFTGSMFVVFYKLYEWQGFHHA